MDTGSFIGSRFQPVVLVTPKNRLKAQVRGQDPKHMHMTSYTVASGLDAQGRRDFGEGRGLGVIDGNSAPAQKITAFLAGLGGHRRRTHHLPFVAGRLRRIGFEVEQVGKLTQPDQ